MDNQTIYHWSELTNTLNMKPNLAMLEKDCVIEVKQTLKGEARGNGGTLKQVIFDKDFVYYYLDGVYKRFFVIKTKEPFKLLAKHLILSLMSFTGYEIKAYQLRGKAVIHLEDLGLSIEDLSEKKS